MVILFKKRKLYALFCILCATAVLVGGACRYFGVKDTFIGASGKTIVIDAGHAAQS